MAGKKRRTEIQIETHEITIIRYGAAKKVSPSEGSDMDADVQAYLEVTSNATDRFNECSHEQVTQKPTDEEQTR